MSVEVALKELQKHAGFTQLFHEMTFIGYRRKKDGTDQEVQITILDAGEGVTDGRYHAYAESDDKRVASGNAADTIQNVLGMVHWPELDK